MNTYLIDGYRIAARSLTQAKFAARELREARVVPDYDPEYEAWLDANPGIFYTTDQEDRDYGHSE